MLRLYWSIGRDLRERQERAGWGGKVIEPTCSGSAAGVSRATGVVNAKLALHAPGRRDMGS
ncbi:hypothetical protein [Salana multivorans]